MAKQKITGKAELQQLMIDRCMAIMTIPKEKLLDQRGVPMPLHRLPAAAKMLIEDIDVEEQYVHYGGEKFLIRRVAKYKLEKIAPAMRQLLSYINSLPDEKPPGEFVDRPMTKEESRKALAREMAKLHGVESDE